MKAETTSNKTASFIPCPNIDQSKDSTNKLVIEKYKSQKDIPTAKNDLLKKKDNEGKKEFKDYVEKLNINKKKGNKFQSN